MENHITLLSLIHFHSHLKYTTARTAHVEARMSSIE
jgi:hypothetical protein